jgi:hypothetical protein
MFSVFQHYLDPLIEEGLLQDVDQNIPSNVYEQLSIAYNQGSLGVINTTRFFVPYYDGMDPDEYDYDLLYEIWRNKDLQEIVRYFNRKIIPDFTIMSYQTKSVRLRIVTNMIFKLVEQGKLSKEFAIRLHLNLSDTLQDEHIQMINEDLPF